MAGSISSAEKATWSGRVAAVQPRIRLTRSFDERSHSYLGYVVRIDGTCGGEAGEFLIAVGEGAHVKHRFQTGMELSGSSVPVEDPRKETAALYKTSGLNVVKNPEGETLAGPPFHGVPPDLETYRARGHRRLDARTYDTKCTTCIWGCRMPVEMIIDQWNPSKKQYRFETFCYGPKSCPFYRAGPVRKVPGRKKACPTPRRTGSTKTPPPTVDRMIEELATNSRLDLRHPHRVEYLGNRNQRRFRPAHTNFTQSNP